MSLPRDRPPGTATKGLLGARADTAVREVAITGKVGPVTGPEGTRIGFSDTRPCPEGLGWNPRLSSACRHAKHVCPTCGRKRCWKHWAYPMSTEEEAIRFLNSAIVRTGRRCLVRQVHVGRFGKRKIFTSEADYRTYVRTRTHRR